MCACELVNTVKYTWPINWLGSPRVAFVRGCCYEGQYTQPVLMVSLLVLVEFRSSSGVSVRKPATSNRLCLGGHSAAPFLVPAWGHFRWHPISHQLFMEQRSQLFSLLWSCTSSVASVCDVPADAGHGGRGDMAEERCSSCPSSAVVQQPLLQEAVQQSHHIRKSEGMKMKRGKRGACFSLWWNMCEHQWKVYLKAEEKLHLS